MLEKWVCSCVYHLISNVFSQLSFVFSTQDWSPPTLVSYFAFSFTLNLYFRFRQGFLYALLASSLSPKLLPTGWHWSIPAEGSVQCRDPENHLPCWSPVPSLALVFRYAAEQWLSPSRSVGPAESMLFSDLKHWVLFPSATKKVFSEEGGEGREGWKLEMAGKYQTLKVHLCVFHLSSLRATHASRLNGSTVSNSTECFLYSQKFCKGNYCIQR